MDATIISPITSPKAHDTLVSVLKKPFIEGGERKSQEGILSPPRIRNIQFKVEETSREESQGNIITEPAIQIDGKAEVVDLSNKNIESISQLMQLNLNRMTKIYLSNNQLRSIDALNKFSTLKSIIANNNQIASVQLNLSSLVELDLSNNWLTEVISIIILLTL